MRWSPQGHRSRALAAVTTALFLLLGMASAPVAASGPPESWHRLNVYGDPPEHERFACLTGDVWTCRYDKVPDPKLGLGWDQTRGVFRGTVTTPDWVCPAWFPTDACDAADTVVSGVGSFTFPRASGGFSVDQQLLVSDDGRLWVYWGDDFQFVCPWYPTFGEALTSDSSCAFAP